MTDAEVDALSAAPSGALTDEDVDRLSAAPPAPAAERPGVFARIKGGLEDIGHATADQAKAFGHVLAHPIDSFSTPQARADTVHSFALFNPAKRHEVERGVSDMFGGYPQRLGEHVDQQMNEAFPDTFERHMAPDQVQADAANGRGFRTVGNVYGMLPANPVAAGVRTAAEVGGAAVARFAPRAAEAASGIARMFGKIPGAAAVAPALKSVAAYESTAPLQAAMSADASGNRGGAALDAATDPLGVGISAIHGGVATPYKAKVMGSEGAQKRAYIEQHGEGAKVGPTTSGKGGVYQNQLHGLPENDAGVGRATEIGAEGMMKDIEGRHEAEHGFPYRGGKEMVKEARDAKIAGAEDRRLAVTAAKEARNANVDQAKAEVLAETAKRGKKIISDIDHEKRVMASEPYRVLKEQLESKPGVANARRDASALATTIDSAIWDADTSDFASAKLRSVRDKMERYRDPGGKLMIPERQLNGFRRTLMRSAKVGHSDVAGEAEAPLRKAAFQARELVDQGPYAPLNKLFAEGAGKAEASRRAVGLTAKPGRDRFKEQEGLTKRLRKAVADPSMIPGEAVPPEADLTPLREKVAAARGSARPVIEATRAEASEQRTNLREAQARRARGDEGAKADRALLGLNPNIGTRDADLNQIALKLGRQAHDTETGGRAQQRIDLDKYRAAHPDQATNTRLPVLMRNKLDLQFDLGSKSHGGILHRLKPSSVINTIKQNAEPLTGRLLYGPASRIDTRRTAERIGRLLGTSAARRNKEQRP